MAAAIVGRAAMRLAKKGLKKKAKKKAASSASKNVRAVGKPESRATSARKRQRAQDEIVARRQGYGGYKAGDTPADRRKRAATSVETNRVRTPEARAKRPFGRSRMTSEQELKLMEATERSAARRRSRRRATRAARTGAAAGAAGAVAAKKKFSDPRGR